MTEAVKHQLQEFLIENLQLQEKYSAGEIKGSELVLLMDQISIKHARIIRKIAITSDIAVPTSRRLQ